MAKFTQKTYRGYNCTAIVANFAKRTFEEKTVYIAKTNDRDAIKEARKVLGIPADAQVLVEKVERTMVVPTVLVDELFMKYGREKGAGDDCEESTEDTTENAN